MFDFHHGNLPDVLTNSSHLLSNVITITLDLRLSQFIHCHMPEQIMENLM
jgi:hypothetical protein